jgi:hypothetical protein
MFHFSEYGGELAHARWRHMIRCLVDHHITGYVVFVLVSTEWVIVCPVSCKIRAVILLLHANNMSATEIHRELLPVRGQNVMIEGNVREWCRLFRDWRENRCSPRRTKFSAGHQQRVMILFKFLAIIFVKEVASRLWNFSVNFYKFSHTLYYEIITVSLGCYKFCARWVPKMLSGATESREWLRLS